MSTQFSLTCDLFKFAHISQFVSTSENDDPDAFGSAEPPHPFLRGVQFVPIDPNDNNAGLFMMASDGYIAAIYRDWMASFTGIPDTGINLFFPKSFRTNAKKGGTFHIEVGGNEHFGVDVLDDFCQINQSNSKNIKEVDPKEVINSIPNPESYAPFPDIRKLIVDLNLDNFERGCRHPMALNRLIQIPPFGNQRSFIGNQKGIFFWHSKDPTNYAVLFTIEDEPHFIGFCRGMKSEFVNEQPIPDWIR